MHTHRIVPAFLLLSALLLPCSGCTKEPAAGSSSARDRAGADGAANSGGRADAANDARDVAASDADAVVENMAPGAFDQLKGMWTMQVESLATSCETMKQMAVEYPDAEADGLIKQLDAKVTEMKTKLAAMTEAKDSAAIQRDVPKWMEEAGVLMQKAMERQQTVIQQKTGLTPPG